MVFVLLLSMTITAYAKDSSTKYHLGKVVLIKEDKSQATVMAGADYNVIKTYRAKVVFLDGPHKGETVNAIAYEQSFKGYTIKYKVGEKVIVTEDLDNTENRFTVSDHYRIGWTCFLLIFFVIGILIIGKKSGIKSLLSMVISVITVVLLIFAIVKGYDPIITALILVLLNTVLTIFIVAGITKKAVSSILGTLFGILVAFILSWVIGKFAYLSGLSDEQAMMLQTIQGLKVSPQGLLYAGIIIGALGAVMDIAISIASSVEEIYKANPDIGIIKLYGSGMQVGKDILGTMTNTLVLAYLSSSLPMFMLIYINHSSLPMIYNMDFMVTEFVRILAGSIGLLFTIPFTCAIASYLTRKEWFNE